MVREISHPPADIRKPNPESGDQFFVVAKCLDLSFAWFQLDPLPVSLGRNPEPPLGDLSIVPLRGNIRATPEYLMRVIGHDRKSDAVNRKDGSQMLQALPSPLATMFKVPSRQRIKATQKGSTDTAVPDVDDLNLSRID